VGGFICIKINNDDNVLVYILAQGQLLSRFFFSFTDFILHSCEVYVECRSRIGEELLLASLESAGSGRRGREVGRLCGRSLGVRGGDGGGLRELVVDMCTGARWGEVRGNVELRLGAPSFGERPCPCADGRGVGGCREPALDTSGKQAMSPDVRRPVVLQRRPSVSTSFSRLHARRNESVLPL